MKVLLTGAAGRIGQTLLPEFQRRYETRAFDRLPVPGDPQAVIGDLRDLAALKTAMTGIEVVVHLAATPNEQPFEELLVPNNIIGVQNVFRAAVECGVRRVVFASSIQTMMGYPTDQTIEEADPPRPITIYGATKVFGEALGRYYHDKHQREVICARLGAFQPYEKLPRHADKDWLYLLWLSPRDAVQFFCRAIETRAVSFAVVFVSSKTRREYMSLRAAHELLGYQPLDDVVAEIQRQPITT